MLVALKKSHFVQDFGERFRAIGEHNLSMVGGNGEGII